ncbi:MAG: PfkB family carbohydrate kinase [Acidobacteriota bacterium]
MESLTDKIRDGFPDKNVLIVGDLVADQFLHGTIARVSREAPVFILNHDSTDTRPGGAANAAANVASLGGRPTLIGVTGRDSSGELLREALGAAGVSCEMVEADSGYKTTTKVRVLAGQHYAARQQVIRIDYQANAEPAADIRQNIIRNFRTASEQADALIVSDYDYGLVNREIFDLAKAIAAERGIPLLLDSRFRLSEFSGATSATPNQDEVEQILGKNFTPDQCSTLRERLGCEALLITCGNKGMQLFRRGEPMTELDAVGSLEPVDVTGAGDTVIAAYALGLAAGLDFLAAAGVANYAGGIVVMKKGTAAATVKELIEAIGGPAHRASLTGASK